MNDKEDFFKTPEGGNRRRASGKRRAGGCLRLFALLALIGFLCLVGALIAVDATDSGGKIRRELIELLGGVADPPPPPEPKVVKEVVEVPVEKVVEKVVEVEVQPPMPSSYVPWQKIDTAELWSEIPVETRVETEQGDRAVVEREREDSYRIDMTVDLTIPRPNQSAEELADINPNLPDMLTDFGTLVESADVSSFYHHLYSLKTRRIQQKVTRLDQILTRHNLYDCETLLEAEHPETGRKVLLAQGEMDVVSDGSDGDRWPELDDYISMSPHYQPFTSYGWAKRTDQPNPLLSRWKKKLKEYEEEFAIEGLSIERNRFLRSKIEEYEREIADMKARSYLIAEADPFIVLPLSFLGREEETDWAPDIGDYAVVVYEDELYPAIAGDAGPSWKFGEASLRIAKHLNENASPYHRPVSDLEVTYLIFPDSADEEKGPPDLEAWHAKCSELLADLGGLGEGYELHQWKDLVAARQQEQKEKDEEAEGEDASAGEGEGEDAEPDGDGQEGAEGEEANDEEANDEEANDEEANDEEANDEEADGGGADDAGDSGEEERDAEEGEASESSGEGSP